MAVCLRAGRDANSQNKKKQTPLHLAAWYVLHCLFESRMICSAHINSNVPPSYSASLRILVRATGWDGRRLIMRHPLPINR